MSNIIPGTRSYLFINDKLHFEGTYTEVCKVSRLAKVPYYIYTVFLNSRFPPDWEDKDGNEVEEQKVPAVYRTIILMLGE